MVKNTIQSRANNSYKLVSPLLHVVSVVAILILSVAVFQLSSRLSEVDAAHTKTELFNNTRVTNLYKCLENKDHDCPEWKYADGRHYLD